MNKLKVYLDTSAIRRLSRDDAPEKTKETLELWDLFEKGIYQVYISRVTLDEIGRCPEPKKDILLGHLNDIEFTVLDIDDEVSRLADEIVKLGILTPKSIDDCRHIAVAVVNGCDCIVSWNFKHIVNIKTIRGVRAVTNLEGYRNIEIVTPSALLEKGGQHMIKDGVDMNKGFTVDDIHRIREENYERMKDMTLEEQIAYYDKRTDEFLEEIRKLREAETRRTEPGDGA